MNILITLVALLAALWFLPNYDAIKDAVTDPQETAAACCGPSSSNADADLVEAPDDSAVARTDAETRQPEAAQSKPEPPTEAAERLAGRGREANDTARDIPASLVLDSPADGDGASVPPGQSTASTTVAAADEVTAPVGHQDRYTLEQSMEVTASALETLDKISQQYFNR